jgi:pimeloyl-ACP methyl ester carboxylesterase
MLNYRVYGQKPYKVVAVHGGPGAPGSLGYVARELSRKYSVLEPFQSENSVKGQVEELHKYILENCGREKVKIVGHSWGAWLAYMYTALHPERVEKLILVSAGSFDERYNFNLTQIRLSRLEDESKQEAMDIIKWMNNATADDPIRMKRFSELMEKADFYDCDPMDEQETEFQYEVFQSVWREAFQMCRLGELMEFGKKIKCPVIAIHGNYDTHPAQGVEEPLTKLLKKKFKFVGLDQCGHYPWKERQARSKFFEILETELA